MIERPAITPRASRETPTVEPFFIRCETCRARLRVRDERFLGQVQSCPKCGSMVQIIAPAGWLAASDAAAVSQESVPVTAAEATATGSFAAGSLLRNPIALWSAGGAAVLIVGGLVGMMALGGEDEVAMAPSMPPTMEVVRTATPTESVGPVADKIIEEETVVEDSPVEDSATTEHAAMPDAFLPLEPVADAKSDTSDPPKPPIAAEPKSGAETRTLTLEVVEPKPSANSVSASPAESPAEYPGVPDLEERVPVAADPPVLVERPNRRTNVNDQLSMSIDTIELPAMPIEKFVKMISEMSAVPIRLDPKVLGDVGLSTRTKVVVQGGDITLRELLDRVLKENKLACEEHDGELVVVRAKQ
jgi:hypothetical protein